MTRLKCQPVVPLPGARWLTAHLFRIPLNDRIEASRRMVQNYDFVISSGGIGPTHDGK